MPPKERVVYVVVDEVPHIVPHSAKLRWCTSS